MWLDRWRVCPNRDDRSGRAPALTNSSGLGVKKKKPVGNGPTGLLVENAMLRHLKLLLKIVVKIGVKVKIIIVRK
jgi:hypothetical protein